MDRLIECMCGGRHWERAQAWLIGRHGGPRAVNKEVKAAVNRKGKYPNTDARRAYMREVMRKRRAT